MLSQRGRGDAMPEVKLQDQSILRAQSRQPTSERASHPFAWTFTATKFCGGRRIVWR